MLIEQLYLNAYSWLYFTVHTNCINCILMRMLIVLIAFECVLDFILNVLVSLCVLIVDYIAWCKNCSFANFPGLILATENSSL